MFKKFIPPLMAKNDRAATEEPPSTSQLQSRSATKSPQPPTYSCDNCDSRDGVGIVATVAVVARVGSEDSRPDPQIPPPLSRLNQRHPWSARDWHAFFSERAGIAEYSGGLSRTAAERLALEHCIVEWLNTSRGHPDPGRCAWCGQGSEEGNQLVPYGFGDRQLWLHARCHVHWYPARRCEALRELATHGIERPASLRSREQSGACGSACRSGAGAVCRRPDEQDDQSS